jgi:hypothetical protein
MFNPVKELNQLVSGLSARAAWERCQKGLRERTMRDTDQEKNANPAKIVFAEGNA